MLYGRIAVINYSSDALMLLSNKALLRLTGLRQSSKAALDFVLIAFTKDNSKQLDNQKPFRFFQLELSKGKQIPKYEMVKHNFFSKLRFLMLYALAFSMIFQGKSGPFISNFLLLQPGLIDYPNIRTWIRSSSRKCINVRFTSRYFSSKKPIFFSDEHLSPQEMSILANGGRYKVWLLLLRDLFFSFTPRVPR